MDRHASGDPAAFPQLYDLVAPRLHAYLLRQTRDHSRAEDLVQQTLLHMHCARGRFIRGARVMPWALSIARRLFLDSVRRRKFERSEGERGATEAVENAIAGGLPADEMVHSKELARMIRRELDRLPEAQRAAFELVKEQGLSHAEAAEVLGTTVGAVKLRAHRTYEVLRVALGSVWETNRS